ncbi:hypothetical protein TNCV_4159211 [Trichonephila clavipes]|nr:hypothetical protein TNCV_4159211 [Trichonephila clavipes]
MYVEPAAIAKSQDLPVLFWTFPHMPDNAQLVVGAKLDIDAGRGRRHDTTNNEVFYNVSFTTPSHEYRACTLTGDQVKFMHVVREKEPSSSRSSCAEGELRSTGLDAYLN